MKKVEFSNVEKAKTKVLESSKKGATYTFCNLLFDALIFLVIYIICNPDIIKHPTKFFADFEMSSLYVVGILFIIIFSLIQLGRFLLKDADIKAKEAVRNELKEKEYKEHETLSMQRISNTPLISNELKDLIIKLDANRASICEFHNGTHNLAGVPFLYCSMNFEEINDVDQIFPIAEELQHFNLARFPFIALHFNDGIWLGSRKEVEEVDPKLAAKLKYNGSEFIGTIVIQGAKCPLGLLTVSFDEKIHPERKEIANALSMAAQKLGHLLDK